MPYRVRLPRAPSDRFAVSIETIDERQPGFVPRHPPRFFLSHWRGDATVIDALQRALRFRGLHAWRDVDDLELGHDFKEALRVAIRKEVSAFIALVTPQFLTREIIWDIEVPEALARIERDPEFLIIPLFCGVSPAELTAACESRGLADLSAFNGYRVEPQADREPQDAQVRTVAQRTLRAGLRPRFKSAADYVPRLLLRSQQHVATVGGADLDIDWTAAFASGCPTAAEWESELMPALSDIRDVLGSLSQRQLHIEVQSRLSAPLAFGEVFSATAKYTLIFGGTNGAWSTATPRNRAPVLIRHDRTTSGPDNATAVVEVSIARDAGRAVSAHAASLESGFSRAVRLEPTEGPSTEAVQDAGWAISAAWEVGDCLRALHDEEGVRHFHLYVAAPAEWCVLLGHTLNAVGKITVHQWHSTTAQYVQACTLGAAGASGRIALG
ncbi:MAG: SAVED domain-containing protein [Gemmatimonadaceae bacterium]